MKSLKTLFLLATTAAALTALYGAGSASATVLCKKYVIPCTPANHYTGEIHAVLPSGTNAGFYTTTFQLLDICGESTLTAETTNTGSKNETVKGKITALTFGSCEFVVKALELGEFEFHYVPSTSTLGRLTFIGTKLTSSTPLGDCVYSAGTGTEIGTFTGGKPAKIDAVATFAKSGGGAFCPADITLEALYEITAPAELYIKEE